MQHSPWALISLSLSKNAPRAMLTLVAGVFFLIGLFGQGCFAGDADSLTLQGAELVGRDAKVFADPSVASKRVALVMFEAKPGKPNEDQPLQIVEGSHDLPAGLYEATFYLRAKPVEVMHFLRVVAVAGSAKRTALQLWFADSKAYVPVSMRVAHLGGKMAFSVSAVARSGFNGMRRDMSESEKADAKDISKRMESKPIGGEAKGDDEEGGGEEEEIDGAGSVDTINSDELWAACDRIEVKKISPYASVVTKLEVEKIHYLPGEAVNGEAEVTAVGGAAAEALSIYEVRESKLHRLVFQKPLAAGEKTQKIPFSYKLDGREFGAVLVAVAGPAAAALQGPRRCAIILNYSRHPATPAQPASA